MSPGHHRAFECSYFFCISVGRKAANTDIYTLFLRGDRQRSGAGAIGPVMKVLCRLLGPARARKRLRCCLCDRAHRLADLHYTCRLLSVAAAIWIAGLGAALDFVAMRWDHLAGLAGKLPADLDALGALFGDQHGRVGRLLDPAQNFAHLPG